MRIAMLATAGAIAFVCMTGSVSAADQFSTLKGVKAIPMSAGELSAVKGMDHHFTVTNPKTGEVTEHETDQHQEEIGPGTKGKNFVLIAFPPNADGDGNPANDTKLVAPSYHGLMKACGNGVIDGPMFLC